MHKTVSISIGNSLFTIEESAYTRLDEYLKSIRKHFGSNSDADEIVDDIEARIGEELSEKMGKQKKVILVKDVEELIRTMGTIEDFEEFEGEEKGFTGKDWVEHFRKVRLYRDADNQVIGGVCAGIANFFDIDPLIVRLAFGLSLFLGGFGFLLYVLLWVLLPEARTTTEKVEMTGGKVTLSAIQKRIDETIPPEKRKNFFQKVVAFPFVLIRGIFKGIAKIFNFIFPIIGRIAGLIILLGAASGIAFITFALFALLMNPSSPYIGFPLREAVGPMYYLILLGSAYFLAAMPIIMVILAGASLITLRNVYTWPATAGIMGTWFVALVVGAVATFSVAPSLEGAIKQYESEHYALETRTFDLTGFTGVEVGGNSRVEVFQSDDFSIELEATKSDIENVSVVVENGVLTLERTLRDDPCMFFCHRRGVSLRVGMPNLSEVIATGSSYGSVVGFDEDRVVLKTTGASSLESDMDVENLEIVITGSSYIEQRGSGTTLVGEITGASSFHGSEFKISNADITLSGASNAYINASGSITGEASGASEILYEGTPSSVNVRTAGASRVQSIEPYDDSDDYDDYEEW